MILMVECSLREAQADPAAPEAWGPSDSGVVLSVQVATNVLTRGSPVGLTIRVRNTSTNDVFFSETDPKYDFQVFVRDGSGRLYRLSPDPSIQGGRNRLAHTLQSSETYAQNVTLKVPDSIQPGDYTLTVEFRIHVNANRNNPRDLDRYRHTLTSNAVSVVVR